MEKTLAMHLLSKMTIKTKLSAIIMMTVTVSLVIASLFFLYYEQRDHKAEIRNNANILVELIGNGIVKEIIANQPIDPDGAFKGMSLQPNIMEIYIFDSDDSIVSKYNRGEVKANFKRPELKANSDRYSDNSFSIYRDVSYQGKKIGSVFIAIDTKYYKAHFRQETFTAIIIIIISLIAALLLSLLFQKSISRPILYLANSIREISKTKNYNIRLEATTNDEIGFLIAHFNELLEQLQFRDRAILKTKSELEKRVKERTSALEKEINERRDIERNRIDRLSRVRKHQQAISELFNNSNMIDGSLIEAMNNILELTGKAMDTAITGIWLYNSDESELVCRGSYNLSKDKFSSGLSLSVSDYPNYFKALKENRVIDASDALNDPRTSEFKSGYLIPKKIQSTLDSPIKISGKPIGVICFEHIGPKRKWTIDEISFAGVITDQISQLILNRERKNNEKARTILLEIFEASLNSNNLRGLLETVHKLINRIFDAPNMYVALYDSQTNRYSFPFCIDAYDNAEDLTPQELDNSLTDYVRRTNEPLLIDETEHKRMMQDGKVKMIGTAICKWLGVPLKTADGSIGVMAIQHYEDENAYSQVDLELMSTISNYVAMAVDRKRIEEIIRDSEARYRTLFDTANDAIFLMQADRFIDCNSKTLEMFGCERDQIINQPPYKFSPPKQPDDSNSIEKALEMISGAVNGIPQFFEWMHCRLDGTPFHAEVSLTKMILKNEVYILAVVRDISERKISEEHQRNLQEKLERAERMESLGVLAGGVAHDLNNMLGPMVGYPELILNKLKEDDPIRKQITRIGNSAKEAADVIQDLLTLARRGRYEMELTDINQVVESYLDSQSYQSLQETYKSVSVEADLDPTIGKIKGSASHLSKVIMNLVVNAFDAAAEKSSQNEDSEGFIKIKSEQKYIDTLESGHAKIDCGSYIILRIIDNGNGIDREDIDKIFEPYYSKKKMGASGSGLGLSVVYGIIKDHKAYYDIFSKNGRGAEFVIYFPICNEKEKLVQSDNTKLSGNESILIVDDILEQREIASEMLTSLGYRISACSNGREAIELAKQNEYDLLIMDMIMEPDFDGLDAYREIVKLKPGQKTIIVSGFSATERVNEMLRLGAGQYIRKPYTLGSLARAVRSEMDKTKANLSVMS